MLKTGLGSRWTRGAAAFVCALAVIVIGESGSAVQHQERKPAVEMTSILGAGLDVSGALTMTHFNLMFGPENGATVDILIKTVDGQDVHAFQTRPDYVVSREAFSRLMVNGAMYAKLDAGTYLLDFVVEGVTGFKDRIRAG